MSAKRCIDWDAQPLGEISDRELARRLGVTSAAVFFARKQRAIKPLRGKRRPCDPAAFADEFGRATDQAIADRHGLAVGQVSYARRQLGRESTRVNWSEQPLGSVPDCELANRFGVDNSVVARARRERAIPQWSEERRCPCAAYFVAFHRRQKFCSCKCQRYHWQLVNRKGLTPEAADCALAVWALKRTCKGGGKNHVEQLDGVTGDYSRRARSARAEGDGRHYRTRRGAIARRRNEGTGGEPGARPADESPG